LSAENLLLEGEGVRGSALVELQRSLRAVVGLARFVLRSSSPCVLLRVGLRSLLFVMEAQTG
jgi:hypothetical protein